MFTRRDTKPLVARQSLPISTIRNASNDEARNAELPAGLNHGSSFHLDRRCTESGPECFSSGRIRQEGIARHDDPFDDTGVWPWTGALRVPERAADPARPSRRSAGHVSERCRSFASRHRAERRSARSRHPWAQSLIDGPGCSREQNSLRSELIDEQRRDDSRVDFASARTPHDDRLAVQMSNAEYVTMDRDFAALLEPPVDRVYLSCDAEDADDRLSIRRTRKEKKQGSDGRPG